MDLAETCPLLIRHQLVSWPTFIQAPIHAPVRESSRLSPPDVRGARCEDRQQLFLKCMAGSPNLIDTAPPGDHDGRARCYTTLRLVAYGAGLLRAPRTVSKMICTEAEAL